MSGTPLITEFLASNGSKLADGDGRFSDWVEIYNPTTATIDLAGWHLTDSDQNLDKWTFPALPQAILEPGEFLIVFASGQLTETYVDPAGFLHADFELSADGEFLALTDPANHIVHAYSPSYPAQRRDVSYGVLENATTFTFIGDSTLARALVPPSGAADAPSINVPPVWTLPTANDAAWPASSGGPGVGFDAGGQAPPHIPNGTLLPEGLIGGDLTDPEEDGSLSGTIFAGGFPGSPANEEPPKGLDNNAFSKWLAFEPSGTYYGFRFADGERHAVNAYTMTSANDAEERDPYSWTLSGSNDGVNYTVVDTRTAQNFASRFETRLYEFANTTSYEYYRFDLQTQFGATGQNQPNSIQVAEFELFANDIDFSPAINLDLEASYAATQSSIFQRIEFDVANPAELSNLLLEMQYDDGFVAYLNGTRVASSNAPELPTWQSNATAERSDSDALTWQRFNLTPYLGELVAGENVLAIHVLNASDSDPDMLSRPRLTGKALIDDTLTPVFMAQPTPGAANAEGYAGIVAAPQFSMERGFYNSPFQLTISAPTPESQVYYTTNGEEPSPTNGVLYTGPIQVSGTSTIRARAYRENHLDSTPVTNTYLFLNDIVRQNYQATLSKGFPTSWGSVTPDYGFDPDVIGNFDAGGNPIGGDLFGGAYAATIKSDLLALPTLSVVMDIDDMFGPLGIYTNSSAGGVAWERATSVELINPDGTPGFQIDAGIRAQGGAFRSHSLTRKHSLRLLFKGEYEGNTKLEYPWFGDDAVSSFDTITLRADANDGYSWSTAGARAQYARDEFGRRSQAALGQHAAHGTRVHLYINGVYWGIYNPVERPDASFSASYYGGEKEDWDAINSGAATDGDMNTWNTMMSLAQAISAGSSEAARTAAYMRVLGLNPDGTDNPAYETYLDATNYIDYLMVNFYGGNVDWPHRNWYASRMRGPESQGFVFHNWDFETSLGLTSSVTTDRTGVSDGAAAPYARLRNSKEFRVLFADRVHRAFFNDGPLSTANSIARYQDIIAELPQAIVAESARWGDMHSGAPYTKAHWQAEVDRVVSFLSQRQSIFLQQLRNAGLYSSVTAPTFNQFGGDIPAGFQLTMAAPAGTIWYTLDGSDPRMIGGGINPNAIEYTGAIMLDSSVRVKARVISGMEWSAVNEASFSTQFPVRISELHYNPAAHPDVVDRQDLEFVELINTGAVGVNLDGAQIGGFADDPYVFAGGIVLAPGERIVVARNPAVFQSVYGTGINLAPTGYGDRNFSNGGELVTLADPLGDVVQSFSYADAPPWPSAPDGNGPSLEIIDPLGDPTDPANWRASLSVGGSPGTDGLAPADFEGDGDVDAADLAKWKLGFGATSGATRSQGDADGDNDVDGADLLAWQRTLGTSPGSLTATASVQSIASLAAKAPWPEAFAWIAGWEGSAIGTMAANPLNLEEWSHSEGDPPITRNARLAAYQAERGPSSVIFTSLPAARSTRFPQTGVSANIWVQGTEVDQINLDLALERLDWTSAPRRYFLDG